MRATLQTAAPGTARGVVERLFTLLAVTTIAMLFVPRVASAVAEGAEELAALLIEDGVIRFAPKVDADRWLLRVTGAYGVVLHREVGAERTGELAIPRSGAGALVPGHYTYALYAERASGENRRVQAGGFVLTPEGVTVAEPGRVSVAGLSEMLGPGLEAAAAAPAFDFLIIDDLVVDGSACIGFDCVDDVAFGFTTLGLVENNLRITFHDTSTVASYPRNDWRIEANSSANGGSNHLAFVDCGQNANLDDCPTNRRIFLVEAGAPADSLRVDNSGRIGIGTDNPVLEIHSRSGDTPSLRLEQTSTSGWAPQTWDVAGNETNFFVRDVTNGSTLPLRIRPGASSNMVYIDDEGVGFGKTSPTAQVDIQAGAAGRVGLNVDTASSPSASAATIKFDGTSYVEFIADGNQAQALRILAFNNGADVGPFVEIRRNNSSSTPGAGSLVLGSSSGPRYSLWVDASGNVRVDNRIGVSNGADTAGTVVGTQTSWFEAKEEISPWDSRGALQDIVDLQLYSYRFINDSQRGDKLNRGLVVFEGDREAWWAMNGGANQTPVLDEVNLFGRLIGAVKELEGQVDALEAEVAARDRAIEGLAQRIEALEAALRRVAAPPAEGSR